MNKSTGITIGGTRYFTGFSFLNEGGRVSGVQPTTPGRVSKVTRWQSIPPRRGRDRQVALPRLSTSCLFQRWSVPD